VNLKNITNLNVRQIYFVVSKNGDEFPMGEYSFGSGLTRPTCHFRIGRFHFRRNPIKIFLWFSKNVFIQLFVSLK